MAPRPQATLPPVRAPVTSIRSVTAAALTSLVEFVMDPLPFPTNCQSPCARVFKLILERAFRSPLRQRAEPPRGGRMNESWFLAFVITPAAVLALGWIAVVLHKRGAHHDRHTPAE